jgi:hypothetical protein
MPMQIIVIAVFNASGVRLHDLNEAATEKLIAEIRHLARESSRDGMRTPSEQRHREHKADADEDDDDEDDDENEEDDEELAAEHDQEGKDGDDLFDRLSQQRLALARNSFLSIGLKIPSEAPAPPTGPGLLARPHRRTPLNSSIGSRSSQSSWSTFASSPSVGAQTVRRLRPLLHTQSIDAAVGDNDRRSLCVVQQVNPAPVIRFARCG